MTEGDSHDPGMGSGPDQADEGGLEVSLANPNRYSEVRIRSLRPWLARLVGALAPEAHSLAVLFTSDRRLREMNRRYRDRDHATDVLSFPGFASAESRHLGDIAISLPTARRQAEVAGHPVEIEIEILLLHGVLHCLGHDHEVDDGEMDRLESRLRREWIGSGEAS